MSSVCVASVGAEVVGQATEWDEFNPDLEWVIGTISISGMEEFSERKLNKKMLSQERPWYKPWQSRPEFDPAIFERDVGRLERFYESEGFYQPRIVYTWAHQESQSQVQLDLAIEVVEGPRASVASIDVEVLDAPNELLEPLRGSASFKLKPGTPFREEDYRATSAQVERIFLSEGFPWVEVERSARVSRDRTRVTTTFRAKPGPYAKIGSIQVVGLDQVSPDLVMRELAFAVGDAFSIEAIEASRAKILALGLFASVSFDWQPDDDRGETAAVLVTVRERPHREIRIGVGYSTEEEAQVKLRWQNENLLGGGQRAAFTGRYSSLVRSLDASLVQPHLWTRNDRGVLNVSVFQQTERMYTRNSIHARPAIERHFSVPLMISLGLQVETARVRDVDSEVSFLIGGVRNEGVLFGPTFTLEWSPVDSLIEPTRGWIARLQVEASTTLLGATYDYYKASASLAAYQPLGNWLVLAARIEMGVADSFGGQDRLPIFERLYAGGENSVRGYQRRQLGPRASNGDPLGGRSLVEGAIEARVPLWKDLGVVGFVDFGQVSLDRFDLIPDDLRYAAGPGLTYATPFGPLSLYAGFPLNPNRRDPAWQIHFSIGFFF